MIQRPLNIIIAGGGIGGCALALFLFRLGVQITILESRSERPTSQEGGFLTISPNGTRVLTGLGLTDKLMARENGIEVPGLSMYDASRAFLGIVPQGTRKRYGFPSVLTGRWDIHEILLDDVATRGIQVRFGAKVKEVIETEDGATVRWTEGDEMKQSKVEIVVGADGIWSAVRKSIYSHIGVAAPVPAYQGQVGVGGVIPVSSVPRLTQFLTHEQPLTMFHGRNGFFGVALYVTKAENAGWWSTYESPKKVVRDQQVSKEESMSEIMRRQKDWGFPVSGVVAAAAIYDFKPQVVPIYEVDDLNYWHTSRMVLIEDAAHATPHGGQGTSQAPEDAAYLAHLIRQMLQSDNGSPTATQLRDVFSVFQEARQPRVNMIIAKAN